MLHITIPGEEYWDEAKEEFVYEKEKTLALEHSLVAISKWESKWHKPFLGKEKHTEEELRDYIKCMTITQNVDPEVYTRLTSENWQAINSYIENPMTATWFREEKNKSAKEVPTSELIYYWMIACQIPFECQKWHLARLLTLIRVCSVKNAPPKKTNKRDMMANRTAMNRARRAKMHSKG